MTKTGFTSVLGLEIETCSDKVSTTKSDMVKTNELPEVSSMVIVSPVYAPAVSALKTTVCSPEPSVVLPDDIPSDSDVLTVP